MQSQSDVRVGEISNFRNMLGLDSVMSSTVGAQSHGHGQIGPEFKTKFLGFRCYAQGDKACFLICQSHKNKGYLLGWNIVKLIYLYLLLSLSLSDEDLLKKSKVLTD